MKKFRTLAEAHDAFTAQGEELSAALNLNEGLQEQVATLSTAQESLTEQVATLTTERDQLQSQFDEAIAEGNSHREQVATLQKEIISLDESIKSITAERDSAQANVDRISQLAQVKGIDPSAAIPVAGQSAESDAELLEKYSKLQGRERTEFFRANKEAIFRAGAAVS